MKHTLKTVDQELQALSRDVLAMGEFAVAQVRLGLDAFTRLDATAALQTVAADDRLDQMEADIEGRSIRFIALRQPMADDLRRPICAMKIAMQLERCGDLAKSIAKRVARMGRPTQAQTASVTKLGELVGDRLAAVVAAYGAGDPERALKVWSTDMEVDELHERILREVTAAMNSGADAIDVCTHLLFIAKNLERIGDHATNIAELVHYEVTGGALKGRPKL